MTQEMGSLKQEFAKLQTDADLISVIQQDISRALNRLAKLEERLRTTPAP